MIKWEVIFLYTLQLMAKQETGDKERDVWEKRKRCCSVSISVHVPAVAVIVILYCHDGPWPIRHNES